MRGRIGIAALVFAALAASVGCDSPAAQQALHLVQESALPGPLTAAHASLAEDCAACHTPIRGVEASACIGCHALDAPLVERQTTAFHATIASCTGCHLEHLGVVELRGRMDHARFAQLVAPPASARDVSERALDCASCHGRQDPHGTLFGSDCTGCHGTQVWSVAEYRHPNARSRDCAQCHAPPPSHRMEHFAMVSQRVARQEHAPVNECFRCHLPTSWNDIRGVGLYDHH